MTESKPRELQAVLVEEQVQFTFIELCRACRADEDQLAALVDEGVLVPRGDDQQAWRFEGAALQRARAALRLTHDLELNPAGAALVLELLDEIDALRARLRRLGGH